MPIYDDLISFFTANHVSKVFFERLSLTNGNPGLMYLYNTENELQNFRESFVTYLPLYINNEDFIDSMDITDDINDKLKKYSKRVWVESNIMPHRQVNVNGIYGELFLDIYLRIVSRISMLISYASKRSFKSNYESKGIDSLGYTFNGTQIELYLSEAKFVKDKSAAKLDLLKDVRDGHSNTNGELIPAHLTKEFLDQYFGFVLAKDISCPNEDRTRIKSIFKEFNEKLNKLENPKKFTELLIEENIKIKFICFAIFNASERHPDSLSTMYDELIDAIRNQFTQIGITNYEIEIIFIPTINSSMTIKEEITKFYD